MMFALNNPFVEEASTQIERLGVDYSEDCALLHGKGFLHSWSASEFETLLAAQECVALGVLAGPSGHISRAGFKPRLEGFIIAKIAADEAEILTFAVDPMRQRRGVGRLLLHTLKCEMTSKNVNQLFLEVDEANEAACALYEKSGFKVVGIRKSYYRIEDNRRSNALIMRADLSNAISIREAHERTQDSYNLSRVESSAKIARPYVR